MKPTILLLSAAFILPAQAQTPAPTTGGSTLSGLLRQAKEAAQTADLLFKDATRTGKGKPFDPCKLELLDFNTSYHQWFVDHFAEYQRRDLELRSAYADIAQRVDSLKSVEMLQVENQSSKKEISLRTVTEFLGILNDRLATAPEDKLDMVIAQMEKPRYNVTGATFAQIQDAIQIMTANLNARLKESSSVYRLEFTQKKRSYDLEFVVSLAGSKEYRFSMTKAPGSALSEETRLQIIASGEEMIDGYSSDAARRYFELYGRMISEQCKEARISYFDYVQSPVSKPRPWLSIDFIQQRIPRPEKIADTTQEPLVKKYKVRVESNDIYVNGKGIGFGALAEQVKLVEVGGRLQMFVVYSKNLFFFDGKNWNSILGSDCEILKVGRSQGVAIAQVKTPSGTFRIDSTGKSSPL